jgi:predicted  nucleic acid-binding Zn-ribbon protein
VGALRILGAGEKVGRADVTAKEQLIRLVRIQELVDTVRQAERVLAAAPGKIEEIENHFRERNAEYVAIRDRFDELELDRKTRAEELEALEESKTKYTDDLMRVKNQKEYAAMLKEIDSVKAQISEHEDAILRDMEEIEKLKGELATHEEHIAQERETVAADTKTVENASSEAKDTIETLTGERRELEIGLSLSLLASVRRLEDRRRGVFLSRALDGTCQSCFVRVRPQVFQEIKLATAVHSCGNCRRYLFYEPGIKAAMGETGSAPAERPAAETPAPADGGVEAVNGGAV